MGYTDFATDLIVEILKGLGSGPSRSFTIEKETEIPEDSEFVRMEQLDNQTIRVWFTTKATGEQQYTPMLVTKFEP